MAFAREGNAARRARRQSAKFLTFLEGVGQRVAYLRTRARLTQQELAAKAEMDLTQLQRIERGEANPTTLVWHDLAGALGVEVSVILKPRVVKNPLARRVGRPRKRR